MKILKRLLLVVLGVIVGAAVWIGYYVSTEDFVITLDQDELQTRLDNVFPVDKNYLIVAFQFTDPEVILEEGSDRLKFRLDITASVPTQPPEKGNAMISSQIRYEPENGEFYLHNFNVETIEVEGLDPKYKEQAELFASLIGKEVLRRYPIYTLDREDRRQQMAALVLQSVEVKDGQLRLILGLAGKE